MAEQNGISWDWLMQPLLALLQRPSVSGEMPQTRAQETGLHSLPTYQVQSFLLSETDMPAGRLMGIAYHSIAPLLSWLLP